MPKRHNLFQDVVAAIYRRLAAEADVVEESASMPHPSTRPREVDVVVRSTNGGQPYILSVEAAGRKRKATVEWVEQLLHKHSRLETSQLVLVAEAGFSEDARNLAIAEGALPIAPEDMVGGDPMWQGSLNLACWWFHIR